MRGATSSVVSGRSWVSIVSDENTASSVEGRVAHPRMRLTHTRSIKYLQHGQIGNKTTETWRISESNPDINRRTCAQAPPPSPPQPVSLLRARSGTTKNSHFESGAPQFESGFYQNRRRASPKEPKEQAMRERLTGACRAMPPAGAGSVCAAPATPWSRGGSCGWQQLSAAPQPRPRPTRRRSGPEKKESRN
jgi:hypothetical protein